MREYKYENECEGECECECVCVCVCERERERGRERERMILQEDDKRVHSSQTLCFERTHRDATYHMWGS
jgi:hypothetical protein